MQFLATLFFACSLVSTSITAVNPQSPQSMLTSLKKGIGDFLCYCITSSEVSDETYRYANDLMKKIDPNRSITAIQKFNTFGEYLFGKHNTIALPFLNYVILNAKALKKLPEEAQRFVIGRSLYSMSHPMEHIAYKVALPLLYDYLFQMQDTAAQKEALAHFTATKIALTAINPLTDPYNLNHLHETREAARLAGRSLLYHILAQLHIAYASRYLEWDADVETCKKLNCAKGAIEYFKKYQAFEGDGSLLGGTSATIPLFELLNLEAVNIARAYSTRVAQFNPALTVSSITIARLDPGSLISRIKEYTPGQLAPRSNWLEHTFWKMPLIKYFSPYASAATRIAALEKLDAVVPDSKTTQEETSNHQQAGKPESKKQ